MRLLATIDAVFGAFWLGREFGRAEIQFLPLPLPITSVAAFEDQPGDTHEEDVREASLGGPVFPGADFSKTKVGWTVGAGLAYAPTDKLVANIDYRYSDFGSTQFATPAAAAGTTKVKLNESAIKVGMSYKF
ncbi:MULTISPECIES: outer membrane beta-barrel protein [unclassified Mesorhizobium]|uniref:outer membrane protein n=1 Tax=unclassified Mesorhizobium TaxID=325217 RepID=UPI00142F1CC2|nr:MULTISPECIES: outer membrane beta-barrel protein [unclassified Mesorhizobium]